MSKYYKVEDVHREYYDNGFDNITRCDAEELYADLPTIEVSEDCISREQVRAKLDYISYAEKAPISIAKRIVENAPSVVPQVPNEDCIGDCNICRFAGCSECDDCINGSQWVRMTREDEE